MSGFGFLDENGGRFLLPARRVRNQLRIDFNAARGSLAIRRLDVDWIEVVGFCCQLPTEARLKR